MSVVLLATFVPGVPQTKGSLSIKNRATGHLADTPKSKEWRHTMAAWFRRHRLTAEVYPGPCRVILEFRMPTASVVRRGPGAGDLDKLDRNVLDALTDAEVWGDDVQCYAIASTKRVLGEGASAAGVYVTVLGEGRSPEGRWIDGPWGDVT